MAYIENAKVLYSRFRGLTHFDWGFEEEFRPRFIKRLDSVRSKLSHVDIVEAGLERPDKTSFGNWLHVLKNESKYPGLGFSEETRRRFLSGLEREKELRDNAAHANPNLWKR